MCCPRRSALVYNMQPLGGEVARLGFKTFVVSSNIVITVRPGSYGLQATAPNLDRRICQLLGATLTVWGVPADPSHDLLRGTICEPGAASRDGPRFKQRQNRSAGDRQPRNPPSRSSRTRRSARSPLTSTIRVDTWQNPENTE